MKELEAKIDLITSNGKRAIVLATSNNYEINSIYETSSGNKMIKVSLIYQDTPQSLILRNILPIY